MRASPAGRQALPCCRLCRRSRFVDSRGRVTPARASPVVGFEARSEDERQGSRLIARLVWSRGLQLAVGGAVGASAAGDGDGDRHRAGAVDQPLDGDRVPIGNATDRDWTDRWGTFGHRAPVCTGQQRTIRVRDEPGRRLIASSHRRSRACLFRALKATVRSCLAEVVTTLLTSSRPALRAATTHLGHHEVAKNPSPCIQTTTVSTESNVLQRLWISTTRDMSRATVINML